MGPASVDRLTPEQRSWNMSRISGKNTGPEMLVRSMLHRLGFRFRLHQKDLPGKPDIVLTGRNTIVLVHGCFWHRHRDCRFSTTPKNNGEFWRRKFKSNVERDVRQFNALTDLGWQVIIVWECETRDPSALAERLLEEIPQKRS